MRSSIDRRWFPRMHNIFSLAEQVLTACDVETKLSATRVGWHWHLHDGLRFAAAEIPPLPIELAKFPDRPPLVDPRELPKRKLNSKDGRVALLHAVAHIEFSAIQLAWDHLYRFREMPRQYYLDWLKVAQEEAGHFEMLRERLGDLRVDYGDLPAHGGLWGIAVDTAHDVMARMALVPRFMEARGLDVTPGMIDRLREVGDEASVAVLQRILEDEVGHVALGSKWFGWICRDRGLVADEEYFRLVDRHMKGQVRGPFNHSLRRAAGFSEAELVRLDQAAHSGPAFPLTGAGSKPG